MKRYVYAFDSVDAAQPAIDALLGAKITEDHISLIARPDIQSHAIAANYLECSMDFAPAIVRGAALGGAIGLMAGIVMMMIPAAGIAANVSVLLAFLAGGAVIGAWSSAIVGSSIPDPIRRRFEDEIERGRVLLIVDGKGSSSKRIRRVLFGMRDPHLLWQSDVSMQKF